MKQTILCIDDEPANLDTLERCLRKDYTVLKATSGPQGLDLLKEQSVDLIICDQQMPEMKGVETLTQSIEISPQSMRILLTGFAELESVIEAINQGQIYRYLTKPWTPKDLLNNIAQTLETKVMREKIQLQNQELRKANEELKTLDKMKTDFVLLVNHELKTPLTAMSSYTQLMQELDIGEEGQLYLTKVHKSIQRLQSLIDDTLLLTKLQSGMITQDEEMISIVDLLGTTEKSVKSDNLSTDHKMEISPPASPILVSKKLMSVLCRKLLENGYQYSPPGSTLSHSFEKLDDHWTWVTSNPIKEKIKKTPEQLLSSFSKSEDILNHTGGAGLGLAILKSIAELFKGEVTIDFDDQSFQLQLKFPC